MKKPLTVEYVGGTTLKRGSTTKMFRLVLLLMLVLLIAPLYLVVWVGNSMPVKETENKDLIIEQQRLEIVKLKYDLKQMAKYAESRQALCTVKARE